MDELIGVVFIWLKLVLYEYGHYEVSEISMNLSCIVKFMMSDLERSAAAHCSQNAQLKQLERCTDVKILPTEK